MWDILKITCVVSNGRQNKWKIVKKKNVSNKIRPHYCTTSLHPFYVLRAYEFLYNMPFLSTLTTTIWALYEAGFIYMTNTTPKTRNTAFLLYCWRTYIRSQQYNNTESVAMKRHQHVPFIAALQMFLPTYETHTGLHAKRNIFSPILIKF
jgi:hypothetical protein